MLRDLQGKVERLYQCHVLEMGVIAKQQAQVRGVGRLEGLSSQFSMDLSHRDRSRAASSTHVQVMSIIHCGRLMGAGREGLRR